MKACVRDIGKGAEEYYSYILIYVDNILCIHQDPGTVLKMLDKYFPLKPNSVGEPDIYLGAKLKLMRLGNGIWVWGLSPSKYMPETEDINDIYQNV